MIADPVPAPMSFLRGGGEMGNLTRRFDWAASPLGPPDQWPQSLRTTLSMLLQSKFPMFLWWGDDLIQFYNDAYRPSLGDHGKHPDALGQKGVVSWPEIWPVIKPLIDQVMAGGEATWQENQLVPINRNGRLEDVYWTFSYSPILNESDGVGGVLVICQETTALVQAFVEATNQKQQLQQLFKLAPIGVAMLHGPDHALTLVNDTFLAMAGRTGSADLMGQPLLKALPQLHDQPALQLLREAYATGVAQRRQEAPLELNVDGVPALCYFDYTFQPLRNETGGVYALLVIAIDATERVVTRREIQAQEQRLHTLFEQAPVAIAVFRGPQFVVEFANPTVCKLWGRTAEQVLNKPLFEVLTEASRQGFEELLTGVLETGNPFVGNELPSLIDRNGGRETVYWNFVYAPLRENGLITGVTVVASDVSEQVAARQQTERSEQAYRQLTDVLEEQVQQRTGQLERANRELEKANASLQQTADYLQSVLNGIPASITMMEAIRDETGAVIDFRTSVFNQPALELTGQSADDILSRTLLETNSELQTNGLFERYVQVLSTGEPAYEERLLDRPAPGYYAFYITRQTDTQGVVITVLNITARKKAEQEVIQTADRLQAVLDASPASIGMLKAQRDEAGAVVDFVLLAANQKFVELSGRSSAELVGSSVTTFADALWYADTVDTLLHVLATAEPLYEERADTRDGKDRYIGISLIKHDDGLVMTGLDITTLKQAEQQQLFRLEEVDESAQMVQTLADMREHIRQRGEFLRATSHDLRGNFGIIAGAASLLSLVETEAERSQMLAMLQRNLEQATQMLTQLLDYSRLEAGQELFQPGSFDAARVLRELVAGLQPMAAERNLTLLGTGPETLLVAGDVVKLRRIAQNLILNALKYTPTGVVSVTWELSETGDGWQFSVHDTGPGLPSAILNRLTSVSAADAIPPEVSGTESVSPGEGIGLFIVRRLIDLLDGQLRVDSGADTGTRMVIEFPRQYKRY